MRGHKVPMRDYFIIDLALSTGLRCTSSARMRQICLKIRRRFQLLLL
jgi:hypothetical protein